MRKGNDEAGKPPPIFAAVLTPHRSLGPAGFLAVMAVLCACSFISGTIFWLAGAWPIVGFIGLDVALVYGAFRLNYRAARLFEEVEVTHETLTVRKVGADGAVRVFTFNPYWARLEVERKPEWGITHLGLAARGQRLPIGEFLNPKDRESFAAAFAAALAEARRGPAPAG
jgi:uncharacterized membrane protein